MLAGLDEDGEEAKLEVTWEEAAPLLGPVGSQSIPGHGMRVAPSQHALLHEQDQGLLSPKAFLHECKKSVGGVLMYLLAESMCMQRGMKLGEPVQAQLGLETLPNS